MNSFVLLSSCIEKTHEFIVFLLDTLILLSFRKDPLPFSAKYNSSLNGSRITVDKISLLNSTETEIAKYGKA